MFWVLWKWKGSKEMTIDNISRILKKISYKLKMILGNGKLTSPFAFRYLQVFLGEHQLGYCRIQ